MPEVVGDSQPLPFAGIVPVKLAGKTFENFDVRNVDEAYAVDLVHRLIETEDPPAGVMIVGPGGTGKSHLAVSTAREYAERGGRAAFVSFTGGMPNFRAIPSSSGRHTWHGHMTELVAEYGLVVVDDIPGSMSPGARVELRELVLASHDAGTKLLFTSNQPVEHLVQQISEMPVTGYTWTDAAAAAAERIEQYWETVEFTGDSYRAHEGKWYAGIQRPATMPRSLGELAVQIRDSGEFPRLFAAILLDLAVIVGSDIPEVEAMRQLLERERIRRTRR
ncbi:MAG TPA: ATP-binding protein [Candidatus Saccharimonadales bacterium]|nr:ATP-binding protein [Candidatus Saccharimonadales bacterium]